MFKTGNLVLDSLKMENKGVGYELKSISGWQVDYKHKRYTDSSSTNSKYECNLFKPIGSRF